MVTKRSSFRVQTNSKKKEFFPRPQHDLGVDHLKDITLEQSQSISHIKEGNNQSLPEEPSDLVDEDEKKYCPYCCEVCPYTGKKLTEEPSDLIDEDKKKYCPYCCEVCPYTGKKLTEEPSDLIDEDEEKTL